MKKYLLIIPLSLLFHITTAQINWGIKAGANFANEKHSEEYPYEYEHMMLGGLAIGLVFDFQILNKFLIRPELFYSMKGSKSKGFDTIIRADETNSSRLSYLELPINLIYKVNRFQFFAGPYAAIFLGGKLKVEYRSGPHTAKGGVIIVPTKNVDEITNFGWRRPFDYGINLGVGYNLSHNIVMTTSYGLGLDNTRPKISGEDSDWSVKNRTINLSLSYYVCK